MISIKFEMNVIHFEEYKKKKILFSFFSFHFLFDMLIKKNNKEIEKRLHPPLPQEKRLRIIKNYRGITLTTISVKVYNGLPVNCIHPEVEKILMENQNSFWRNQFTNLQILMIHQILIHKKISRQHWYLLIFPRHLIPYTGERWSKYFSIGPT